MSDQEQNPLSMSDEDVLNMTDDDFLSDDSDTSSLSGSDDVISEAPAQDTAQEIVLEGEVDPQATEDGSGDVAVGDNDVSKDGGVKKEDDPTNTNEADAKGEKDDGSTVLNADDNSVDDAANAESTNKETSADKDKAPKETKDGDKTSEASDEGVKDGSQEQETPADFDFKAGYEQIMGEFRANGENFRVKTPQEAVSLMQRGVDYSKKMQQLKPNLQMMRMLENNNLLDPEKIGFMIDVQSGNPEAIKKFLKDSKIDPMDLDIQEETQYTPNDHTVSDGEMAFTTALDDLQRAPGGKETIREIESNWDSQSQRRLAEDPSIMGLMHEQRANGIYNQISSEVNRLKVLGDIPENTSFLDAYKAVGDVLHNSGQLKANGVSTLEMSRQATPPQAAPVNVQQEAPAPAQPAKVPLESRPAKAKPSATHDPRVAAAAPTRTVKAKAQPADFNPLSMSDEEFEKQTNFSI